MNPVPTLSARAAPVAAPSAAISADSRAALKPIRALVLLYIALWVLEGTLRKWILPQYANPLLVIRDPVLLCIYGLALVRGVFPKKFFVGWIIVQGILALLVSMAATDAPLIVEIFGLRASYLHLPLIYVIPAVFNAEDVRRVGFWLLAASPPMAVLVFLQFISKPTALLNAGAGGKANVMLQSAFGHIRPSGTFSFTNGLTDYSVLVAAFFLWQLFERKIFPRLLWLAAGGALIVLVVLSGSRSLVGTVALLVGAIAVISIVQPRYWLSAIKLGMVGGLALLVIGSSSIFQEGIGVFAARFGSSSNVQTGFVGRFFESFYKPYSTIEIAKPLGVGLGMGTNVAAGLANEGRRSFLLAETDPARVILESGPTLGLVYQFLRALMALQIGALAFNSLARRASTLPLLIFSGMATTLLIGEFSQPTELGYAVIAAGLCLAANQPRVAAPQPDETDAAAPPTPTGRPTMRGRSVYAERLHGPSAGSGDA